MLMSFDDIVEQSLSLSNSYKGSILIWVS